MRIQSLQVALVIAASSALAAQVRAQHQHEGHVDVRPHLSEGRIVIGAAEIEGGLVIPIEDRHRVFGAELGEEQPLFSDHPGFLAESGALAGGAGEWLAFDVSAGLRYWDGADFGSAPGGESLAILLGSQQVSIASGAVAGFNFAQIDAVGGVHQHIEFYLLGSDGNPDPDDGVAPATGIYLLEIVLRTTMSGVGSSDPFWVVFNNGDTEEHHDAAMTWVESNLAPEPATGLMLLPLLAVLRRRSR